MNAPHYILTPDGNITIRWNGTTHSIGRDHVHYQEIVDALNEEVYDNLDDLLTVFRPNTELVEGLTITEEGEVSFNGEAIHGLIADRLYQFMQQGLPYKPLARFLENLLDNPSFRSRQELYGFLEHGNFPITEDGCFIAYKSVTPDFKDWHTRSYDNSVGAVHEMPRQNVDDDFQNACSVGFHVGAYSYASTFNNDNRVIVAVKVNPRDAVSVPYDHDATKLRVCRYEVVEVCEKIYQQELFFGINVSELEPAYTEDSDDADTILLWGDEDWDDPNPDYHLN
jgi:hypothetical protein